MSRMRDDDDKRTREDRATQPMDCWRLSLAKKYLPCIRTMIYTFLNAKASCGVLAKLGIKYKNVLFNTSVSK